VKSTRATGCTRETSSTGRTFRPQRQAAIFEASTGLPTGPGSDRAEELSTKLDGSPFEHASLGFLIAIYEQEKAWAEATRSDAAPWSDRGSGHVLKEVAHYYCEIEQAARW